MAKIAAPLSLVRLAATALLLLLLLLVPAANAERNCGSTHPYVGFTGYFSTRAHRWAGRLTVLDDCTFVVNNFEYDGTAPAVYWWGASDRSSFRYAKRSSSSPRFPPQVSHRSVRGSWLSSRCLGA